MSKEKDGQAVEGPKELAERMCEKYSYAPPVNDLATAMVLRRDMGRDLVEVIAALETDATVIDAQAEQLAAAQELSAAQAQQIEDEETAGIKQSRLIMDLKQQLATAQAERKELARTIGGCLEPDENGISVCDPPCIVCRVLGIKAQEGGG